MPLDPALEHKSYPLRTAAATRSEDVNAGRHVSAIALATILENDRTTMLLEVLGYDRATSSRCAMVHLETSFLSEVMHPAMLEVATGIAAIGRTSFKFGQALFNNDVCVCLSLATYVNLDALGSTPIGEDRVQALTANLLR